MIKLNYIIEYKANKSGIISEFKSKPIYLNLERILYVTEGDYFTEIGLDKGSIEVEETVKQVLSKIKTS